MRIRRVHAEPEFWLGIVFVVVAGLGWRLHSSPLALVGAAGVLATVMMFVWQRRCLDGVSYRRALGAARASFGEVVSLDVELVNDKLLPLTFVHVEDEFPRGLSLVGGTLVDDPYGMSRRLVNVLPLLPYQRVRRHMTIVCDQRGRHTIGPGRLSSGDPIGYKGRERAVREQLRLVVYPKLFALDPPQVVARVMLGDQRVRMLLGDPSRVAGVRDYRSGDPVRAIDWRASARSAELLVREHEPTASLRAAVFINLPSPRLSSRDGTEAEVMEFTIAVAASVIVTLAEAGIAVGLFGSGTAQGRPVSHTPSSAPSALPAMLELLAEMSPYGMESFEEVLANEGSHLSVSTSVVVVASDFSERALIAIAQQRRRSPVTAVFIAATRGAPPPPGAVDSVLTAQFSDGWKQQATLELAL